MIKQFTDISNKKTFKELADELGVSKQAVYKRYKGPLYTEVHPYVETIDGIVYINSIGQSIIKAAFMKKSTKKDSDTDTHTSNHLHEKMYTDAYTDTPKENSHSDEIYSVLVNQLKVKDQQIERQQEEIKSLIMALEKTAESLQASQNLHAGTMIQIENKENKTKGFRKLFGRNKKEEELGM